MKVNISVEMTPQEVREVLGLPDMGRMQAIIMEKITERVASGEMEVGDMMDLLVPKPIQNLGKKLMESTLDSFRKSGKPDKGAEK